MKTLKLKSLLKTLPKTSLMNGFGYIMLTAKRRKKTNSMSISLKQVKDRDRNKLLLTNLLLTPDSLSNLEVDKRKTTYLTDTSSELSSIMENQLILTNSTKILKSISKKSFLSCLKAIMLKT